MITPHNILRHELIGLRVDIVEATHRGYVCSGKIVDETKNTIKIRLEGGMEKTLPKDCIALKITLPDETVVRVDGKLLVARPEERLKKRIRIRF